MRRTLLAVALVAAAATAAPPVGRAGTPPSAPAASRTAAGGASAPAVRAQEVIRNLYWPAAFTFAPDGRVFYGERFTGKIRIVTPSPRSNRKFFTITNVSSQGEQGLLGLALDPDYPASPFVYAYATRLVNGVLRNQILRIRDAGGTGTEARVIFSSDTVSGAYHDGGRILFGPDGMLYAVVGEAHDSSNAQDLSNDAGKLLRMTTAGAAPPDNPIPGSLIYAYGIRNSFGFTFDPLTGRLWETENGPECNDEINLIQPGRNYGWGPSEHCSTPPAPPANTNLDGPDPVLPLAWFGPIIVPVGDAFCDGCGIRGAQGRLFFGALNPQQIRVATPTADRLGIASMATVYTHSDSPLSMEVGPDGGIYFSDPTGIWRLASR